MYNLPIPLNLNDLDLEITRVLGDKFDYFIVDSATEIIVHVKEPLTVEEEDLLESTVLNYDDVSSLKHTVTPRQLRTALIVSGHSMGSIEAIINTMPEPNKSLALIAWEYASVYERSNPLVNQLGAALGLTQLEIDTVWRLAGTL
jgi:hypothetical protein